MLRLGIVILSLLCSIGSFASNESSLTLLDNRFRVDPTISQITFVIYREQNSRPVVLVRPDGFKYYASRHPDYVRWYQESSMDIVSIDKPMPGPWQAIGQISPNNHVRLISHLQLETDQLPHRLYQDETIKFTARLTSDGEPLLLRDFLDRVKLTVTFTRYVDDEQQLPQEMRPIPEVIGQFTDDGRGLDEKPGDGVFTVALPITPEPGKYRVRITSGNGVFLRAQEQVILVYPTPVVATFIQSRTQGVAHQISFNGERGMIEPGSMVAHIEHRELGQPPFLAQGQAEPSALGVVLTVPNEEQFGNFAWNGQVYATDLSTQRPLIFPIREQTYGVVSEIDLATTRRMQEAELENLRRLEQEKLIQHMREQARRRTMMYIIFGNLFVIVVALAGWFIRRKLKAKAVATQEMNLNIPKKP